MTLNKVQGLAPLAIGARRFAAGRKHSIPRHQLQQIGRPAHASAANHQLDAPRVPNIVQRVGGQEHHIGQLAREPIKAYDEIANRMVDYTLSEQARVRAAL